MSRSVASAPGKVLVTGGYLVLERPNAGLVLSVGARFYAAVEHLEPAGPSTSGPRHVRVRVHSPQFERTDAFEFDGTRLLPAPPDALGARNRFVEYPLSHCLALARSSLGEERFQSRCAAGLSVTLLGGNDFYSHRVEARAAALAARFPRDGGSGLGSSAALVTALVAALLHFFGLATLPPADADGGARDEASLRLVHNVAQLVHCRAQGKIGSGFDVSAAVYGSQRYVRFPPATLDGLLAGPGGDEDAVPPVDRLERCVRGAWEVEQGPLRLPPGLALVVGEVCGGSNTPLLVSAVLRWRAARTPEVERVWGGLAAANGRAEAALRALERAAGEAPEAYAAELAACGRLARPAWGATGGRVAPLLAEVWDAFAAARGLLRELGAGAGVPVEPPEQSARADAAMALPGVLAAGVPGAGGHDALFGLAVEGEARATLERAWLAAAVCPLPCRDGAHAGVASHPPDALPALGPAPRGGRGLKA